MHWRAGVTLQLIVLLAAWEAMVLAAVAVLAILAGPMPTRSRQSGPDRRLVLLRQFRMTYRHAAGHGAWPDRSRGVTPVGFVPRRSQVARLPPMLADVWQGKTGLAAAFRA